MAKFELYLKKTLKGRSSALPAAAEPELCELLEKWVIERVVAF